MKNIILFFLAIFSYFITTATEVELICKVENCEKIAELAIYQFEGFGFSKLATASKNEEGAFVFSIPVEREQFIYLGKEVNQLKPIILGGKEKKVLVKGVCDNFSQSTLEESAINVEYEKLKIEIGRLKSKGKRLMNQYQSSVNNPDQAAIVLEQMDQLDKQRISLLESHGNRYPILAEIAALNTYLSFQNNQEGYYDEVDYFANEFFRFTDFTSELNQHNPWVYESVKEYTRTLSSINIDKLLHQSYLDDLLNKIPAKSATYQMALSGIVVALEGSRHPNYPLYGKRLLQKYEKSHADIIANIKKKITLASSFLPGAVAPDFTQLTPEGDSLSLSDLRGKVVLVDFWASWCGPCRRENPHVKQIYEKYKDKGFDILGVSLDRNKKSWVSAIEKDGLPWHHISDLKGWKNEVALLYSVSSIPHTLLLDQEGKIIASKLRSPQLEMELAKLFGEN